MNQRTIFGRYELIQQIGMGGMADLYLAEMSGPYGFNKRVAIKKIRQDLNRHGRFREMFLHESRIMAALGHRNLVQVLELGEVEGELYMCLEYVPGCDLAEVIDQLLRRNRAMEPALAAWLAREICQGLRYVHELRDPDGKPMEVIHRDVNPSNVLISRDGDVKLGDFGIAKSMARLVRTVQGQLLGKLGYHSPEQVRGEDLGPTSDLYSVGLILYELLTLQRYIQGHNEREILRNTARPVWRPILPERNVPKALESIVARAVRLKPEDCYPSAEAFSQALDGFLETADRNVGSQDLARLTILQESASATEPPTDQDTLPELELPQGISAEGRAPKTETIALEADPLGPRTGSWLWLLIPVVLLAGGLGIYLAVRSPRPESPPVVDSEPVVHPEPVMLPEPVTHPEPVKPASAAVEPRKIRRKKRQRRRRPAKPAAVPRTDQDLPRLEELKQEYKKQQARLRDRGVQPKDSPAIDRLSTQTRRLISKSDRSGASESLGQLADAIDSLKINHQFVERKMARLNRALERAGMQSAYTSQIRGVVNHAVANRFEDANAAINRIFGELRRRKSGRKRTK